MSGSDVTRTRNEVDDDTGWIVKFVKSVYVWVFLCRPCIPSPHHAAVSSDSGMDDILGDTDLYVSELSARLSCGQRLMGSLSGFSIPCRFLHHPRCWRRSRHGLYRHQWNSLLPSFQVIHKSGYCVKAPPCGTFQVFVGSGLAPPNLALLDKDM